MVIMGIFKHYYEGGHSWIVVSTCVWHEIGLISISNKDGIIRFYQYSSGFDPAS